MKIRHYLYASVLGLAVACSAEPPAGQVPAAQRPLAAGPPAASFTAAVQPNADGSFGYVVSANGRPLILQPHVPGRPGTRGFATAAQAGQVAQLVAGKLRRGQMPPSVTAAELDSLGL